VAAIGYCFGGTVALELARSGAAIKAVVGFHPGLTSARPADSAGLAGGPGLACDQVSDERSWSPMLDLFDEVFV
jgi:dienelactone hydrolase